MRSTKPALTDLSTLEEAAEHTLSAVQDSDAETAAFLRAVGDRVRLIRARRAMSRKVLSKQSGVSERYLAQLEGGSGNASIVLLRRVARGLSVPLVDLIAEAPERSVEGVLLQQFINRLSEPDLREARALLFKHFSGPKLETRRRRLALIGLRGAGKSSLGHRLAEHRGVPFVELDREIERVAGIELSQILEIYGQEGFRRFERTALEGLVDRDLELVTATGGGLVTEAQTFELLLSTCVTVWVRALPEEHMSRVIEQGDFRPMRDNSQAMEDLKAILESREALYSKADHILDTSGRTPDESFRELLALLG